MSDRFYFHGQFRCMYCTTDLDPENAYSLASGDSVHLVCPQCGAQWQFWVKVQLNHRLIKGGKYNRQKNKV
ncbi:hypothetical protein HY624_02310 [Candidatus Uhrbacteria bacterium]|nr:hypothetical protein [Candidatus Uhrbacteria bacterium]